MSLRESDSFHPDSCCSYNLTFDAHSSLQGGSSVIDILIATPGRLMDHIRSTPGFSLQHLRFLVSWYSPDSDV